MSSAGPIPVFFFSKPILRVRIARRPVPFIRPTSPVSSTHDIMLQTSNYLNLGTKLPLIARYVCERASTSSWREMRRICKIGSLARATFFRPWLRNVGYRFCRLFSGNNRGTNIEAFEFLSFSIQQSTEFSKRNVSNRTSYHTFHFEPKLGTLN